MSERNQIINHISIGVKALAASKPFYTAVLGTLNLSLVYESPAGRAVPTLGYGPDPGYEVINVFEYPDTAPPGSGCHLAFNAPSRGAVEAFHAAGLRNGGVCNGPPGLREEFGEGYFATFVIDPDGWRLEAVFKG